MSAFLVFLIGEKICSVLMWGSFWEVNRQRLVSESLGSWEKNGKRLPFRFLDKRVRQMAGPAGKSKTEKMAAARLTGLIRYLVSTAAFEQVVAGFTNRKTLVKRIGMMRQQTKKAGLSW